MANEVRLSYTSGSICYFRIRNAAGQIYNFTTSAFVAWSAPDYAYYCRLLTDKSGDFFVGNFPALAAGTYFVEFMLADGPFAASDDEKVSTVTFVWSGTAEVQMSSLWGAGAYTVTIKSYTTGGAPISGGQVWVNSLNSSAGAVVAAQTTGADGAVAFRLDTGTYYVFSYKPGHAFTENGILNRITVTGAGTHTIANGVAQEVGAVAYYTDSFLTRAIEDFRENIDEPQVNVKYSDARVIRKLEEAYGMLQGELRRLSVTPVVARYIVTYADGVEAYALPAALGSVLAVYLAFDGGGRLFYSSYSRLNPQGRGVWLEGKTLHIQPGTLGDGAELTVEYVPTCPRLCNGTCTVDATGKLVTLGAAYQGTKDLRVNAYGGCVLRVIADSDPAYNVIQERGIAAYAPLTGVATLDAALDPNPRDGEGTTYFEIAPAIPALMDSVVPLYAAYLTALREGVTKRADLLRRGYLDALKSVQLETFYSDLQNNLRVRADNFDNRRFRRR